MELNFGKYRGKEIKDIPAGYLRWLLKTVDMTPDQRTAVRETLYGKDWRADVLEGKQSTFQWERQNSVSISEQQFLDGLKSSS